MNGHLESAKEEAGRIFVWADAAQEILRDTDDSNFDWKEIETVRGLLYCISRSSSRITTIDADGKAGGV